MSDISQIQVNGTTYDLCDATARTDIANLQDSVLYLYANVASQLESAIGTSVQFANLNRIGKLVFLDVRFDTSNTTLQLNINISSFMPVSVNQAIGTVVGNNGSMLGTVLIQENMLIIRTNTSSGSYADMHITYFTE